MAAKADNRVLPTKEAALFRQLAKQYETKQYKKGVKNADAILKKFPDNGETLAMKGLLLNSLERKEEAYELVKRGVKNDLRSHVCWHVYGLLYRSDREYDEAIKCYKNALRMDKENLTIQMRDLPGFLETRQTLLELKSNNKQNWISFAVAHHLNGHHEVAAKVLESFTATVDEEGRGSDSEAYEHSEMALYKALVLEEGGMYADALAVLEEGTAAKRLRDPLGVKEQQARLFLALGRQEAAEAAYRGLVAINTENYNYHAGLQAALKLPTAAAAAAGNGSAPAVAAANGSASSGSEAPGLSEEQRQRLTAVYVELQEQYPCSSAARRMPLDFLEGEAFVAAADSYVRKYLLRGIPSLFSDLKPLYQSSDKAELLGHLFERMLSSLTASGSLPPLQADDSSEQQPAPQALVWVLFYLAQHHDRLGNTAEALQRVDECIQHTPTLIEAYVAKAKILKHAGDLEGAARLADTARRLDLADRYLNCTAAKAMFKAGHAELGESTAALFTRDGEQANSLFDMQAMWYEVASGRAYLAQRQYGKALKRFLKVQQHFDDFQEDQFDFHGYCIRKMTLRAYIDMLRMEDRLFAHPSYLKGIQGAVLAYIQLHDRPAGSRGDDEAALLAGMSPEEQKRHRQKKRKEEQRRAKEAAEAEAKQAAEAAAAAKKGEKAEERKKKDTDPDGRQLAAVSDPLAEAAKLLRRLREHAGDKLLVHQLSFEVFLRQGKLLLATQATKKARQLAGEADPSVHSMVCRLADAVVAAAAAPKADAPAVVQQVAEEEAAALLGASTASAAAAAAYRQQWAAQHAGSSVRHAAAAAEVAPPDARGAAVQQLLARGPTGARHADCVAVCELLAEKLQLAEEAGQWREQCAATFRWSPAFGGADRVSVAAPWEEAAAKAAGDGGEATAAASANGVTAATAKLAL
ncbi:N-terminal acetyltransferase A complex auxiliary subunit [Chlorella vulgaris]